MTTPSVPTANAAGWKKFAGTSALWAGAALAAHFLTTVLIGAPPRYLVPGILVAGAVYLALIDRTPLPGEGKLLKRGVGLLFVTFAAWLTLGDTGGPKIAWQPYSEQLLDAAQRGGRPVMIDFTSRACPPCAQMDRRVFSNARVVDAANAFLPLRADLTELTPANAAIAEKFGIQAFPTIVFIGADGRERRNLRLVGFENATFFRERLEAAR
jgi:thioredoxin:protein disulfide reductase